MSKHLIDDPPVRKVRKPRSTCGTAKVLRRKRKREHSGSSTSNHNHKSMSNKYKSSNDSTGTDDDAAANAHARAHAHANGDDNDDKKNNCTEEMESADTICSSAASASASASAEEATRQSREPEKDSSTEIEKAEITQQQPARSSTCVLRANFVVVGINAVARGLERGTIRAVITCSDVRPPGLVKHLLQLSGQAGVPHCQLQGVQRVLSHMFRIKRVNAVGLLASARGQNIDVDELCSLVEAHSVHNPPTTSRHGTPKSPSGFQRR